jgi:hypothetical protein
MRMAPGRGQGHLCWWPLILKTDRALLYWRTAFEIKITLIGIIDKEFLDL